MGPPAADWYRIRGCTDARGCSKLGETAGTEKPFPANLLPIGTSGQLPRHVFTYCRQYGTVRFAALQH